MKKQCTIISAAIVVAIGSLLFAGSARAATDVSGNIASDTTWTLVNSPYIVTATVQVLQGSKLTIEPGVIVKFNKGSELAVDGEIHAVGDINNLITFTTNELDPNKNYKPSTDWYWGGIRFSKNSTGAIFSADHTYLSGNIIKYSIIEYADIGLEDISNASLFIDNSIIRYNNWGLSLFGQSIVSNNLIDSNATYGIKVNSGNPIVHNNLITNNIVEATLYPDFDWWGLAAFTFFGGSGQVYNNIIKDNGRDFSFSYLSNPEINYNNILSSQPRDFLMQQNTDIQAKYNFFGTTDKSIISNKIYDYYDNVSLGKVNYEPYALAELKFDGTDTFSPAPVTTCTSFTYSSWSACQSNGTHGRTLISSSPSGCTGGSPVLTQSCTYVAPSCTSFTYSDWSACQSNGTATRTIASSLPSGCSGGSPMMLTQSCTYVQTSVPCASYTYSNWGTCVNNQQSRTIISSQPAGCSGGYPTLSQSCNSSGNATAGSYSKNINSNFVKTKDYPAVYWISADNKRYLFSNRDVFGSWFVDDFSGLRIIEQSEFDNLQSGENLTVKPGNYLKFDNSAITYYVQSENSICKAAKSIGQVYLIQSSFEADYRVVGNCH